MNQAEDRRVDHMPVEALRREVTWSRSKIGELQDRYNRALGTAEELAERVADQKEEIGQLKKQLQEARGARHQTMLKRVDRFQRALVNIALGDVVPKEEASLALLGIFEPLTSPLAGDPTEGT